MARTPSAPPPGEEVLARQHLLSGRDRILEVALAAFRERGYADVTMQQVAEAAGLTKAAVYYHFGDKEALFGEAFLREMDLLYAGIEAELAVGPTLRAQLERVARFLLESGRVEFGRLISDFNRYVAEERRQALVERARHPYVAARPAFARAQATGEIGPLEIDTAVSLFFALVFGQIRFAEYGWAAPEPPEGLAAVIAQVFLRGASA